MVCGPPVSEVKMLSLLPATSVFFTPSTRSCIFVMDVDPEAAAVTVTQRLTVALFSGALMVTTLACTGAFTVTIEEAEALAPALSVTVAFTVNDPVVEYT